MKWVSLVSTILVLSYGAFAMSQDSEYRNRFEFSLQTYEIERAGIRHYDNGEYEKAFESLRVSAQQGLKNSQHYLGIMYLKGLSAPHSIELGMGWLGVANEIPLEDWTKIYSTIYKELSDKQKFKVDIKVNELKASYGMKAQNLSCQKKGTLSSRRKIVQCQKNEDSGLWVIN